MRIRCRFSEFYRKLFPEGKTITRSESSMIILYTIESDRREDSYRKESGGSDSDKEEDLLTEVENTTMPPLADVYHSPDSTVWNKTPLPSSQTRSYNIIRESGNSILSETVEQILRFIRFDNPTTRPARVGIDKAAAISDMLY
ncbi:hypothetical protein QE152_g10859 [Popillia japonica]|uniref:Uncharacterized protein n=1 Tax=Popillia japonica TaxID=7064 RepID=A0AAW1LTC4_POPJA